MKSLDYAFEVVAGSSKLHIACFMGKINTFSFVLDHKANINIATAQCLLHVKKGMRILDIFCKIKEQIHRYIDLQHKMDIHL